MLGFIVSLCIDLTVNLKLALKTWVSTATYPVSSRWHHEASHRSPVALSIKLQFRSWFEVFFPRLWGFLWPFLFWMCTLSKYFYCSYCVFKCFTCIECKKQFCNWLFLQLSSSICHPKSFCFQILQFSSKLLVKCCAGPEWFLQYCMTNWSVEWL